MSIMPGIPGVAPPTEQVREEVAESGQLRKMSVQGHPGIQQRLYGLEARLTRGIEFEEYIYWAKVEREMEKEEFRRYKAAGGGSFKGMIKGIFKKDPFNDNKEHDTSRALQGTSETAYTNEKAVDTGSNGSGAMSPIAPHETHQFDAEWRQAARALRSASWGAVFYLITTDILGWGQTPYVFANTGYGLGVGIFVLMGIAAAASGWMIWKTFLGLDSSRYPMLSFGDPFFRLFGPNMRHVINVLQSLQMFLSVAILLLGQTGVLAQLGGDVNLCFIACAVIIMVVGMASGFMRSLKHVGYFANMAVWLNIISFIIICVAAAKYGPDITPQVSYGILPKEWLKNPAPVKTFIGTPPNPYQPTDSDLFAAQFNGINSMVYAYSGALLFVAFLAEMRNPMDFWKAVFLAQFFIMVVYIFFGAFTYTYYGQYAYSVITQVVQPLRFQIVSNVLGLITGWLAIFLYFNVGMKTVYIEVGHEILGLPHITTKKGKLLWWGLGPIYWILAFVVAMSVPQFNAFTNLVGGLVALNFTYSFSGMMFVAYKTQEGALQPGEGFDPATGITTKHDKGMKRLIRGYFKNWYWTIPGTIYTMAGLAASGMGSWAGILALEAAYGPGGSLQTSWSCFNPYYNPGG